MKHIKAYKPESSSLGSGQVLSRPYTFDEGRIVLKEMIDSLCLDLVAKN
jgi:DNA polymerase V